MIRLSKLADYSIVLLAQIAVGEDDAKALGPWSASDLAERTTLPLPTVSKLLKALARADVLASHRGAKGGYTLARPAEQISVGEVIDAIEGPLALTECSQHEGDSCCGLHGSCPVRINWQRINIAIRAALAKIPLADMIRPFGPPLDLTGPVSTAIGSRTAVGAPDSAVDSSNPHTHPGN